MTTNREAGLDFKRRVLIYLLQQNLRVADPKDGATKLSDLVGNVETFTDIAGLEPWVIDVRTSAGTDLSGALTDASNAARASESEWPVVIMSRRGAPIEDAYAVLPLHVMTEIFRGRAPQLTRPRAGILG